MRRWPEAEQRRRDTPRRQPQEGEQVEQGTRHSADPEQLAGQAPAADAGEREQHQRRQHRHRNFQRARDLAERQWPTYLSRAENEIGEALAVLFRDRERTLQRLSATFRRADLVDDLLSAGDK